MSTWKDTTTYSQGDKVRKPTGFTAQSGRLKITVTCGHIYYRPNWIFHCHNLQMDTCPLPEGITKEAAQNMALRRVTARLEEMEMDLAMIKEFSP